MKIAILTDSFVPYISGVTTYCIELAKELTKKGHTVMIMAPKYPGENIVPIGLEKVKIVRMRSVVTMVKNVRVSIPNITKVVTELKKFKANIIETENPVFLGLDGLVASKILGIPCVSVFHTLATSKEYIELFFKTKNPLLEKAVWAYHQKFYGSSEKAFVFTSEVYDLLIKHGVEKNKIDIVQIFFDFYNVKLLTKVEKKVLKKYYNLKKKVAVYLGRLSPEKNLSSLIKIWKGVIKKYPDSTLLLIGTGNYDKELRDLVMKEKLTSNVVFLGEIKHEELMKSGLLSICDIFVSASTTETFGLTGIEAMAHKLPVVLPRSQGLAEVVDRGGILCEPNNIDEFTKAILELFQNEKLRSSMGQKARSIASLYNSQKVVAENINRYKSLIKYYKPRKISMRYISELTKNNIRLKKYKEIFRSIYKSDFIQRFPK